jgi:predicted TIM-barrel fold metal-dependent hydrolase
MAHGGDPWADICVKLMKKWENLYYMSSAYSPRRLPSQVIEYLDRGGTLKVMWASDYPILDFARCRSDIEQMGLSSADARYHFAYANASRVLLGRTV